MLDTLRGAIYSVVATGLLTGCQVPAVQYAGTPDPKTGCTSISHRLAIDPPPPVGLIADSMPPSEPALPEDDSLLLKLNRMFVNGASSPNGGAVPLAGEPVSNSMLFLSGGSQNGAFGAGFLAAWAADRTNGLPRFRVVTGISTGALQSTFAFLYRTQDIETEYRIANEGRLLHPFTKGGLKSKSKIVQAGGALSLARKGAIAELQPLRERLHELIDDTTLRQVASEAGAPGGRDERVLLVGAVEMDTGDEYVFDLTEAARRYVQGNGAMRECYIEALMASSSVPMAALPVFIEGKMYIDGGARFGVISDFLSASYARQTKRLPGTSPRNLFILVNGTLEADTTCELKNCDEYPMPPTTAGQVPHHASWTFDKLGLRSMSILINQSYRSSVYLARREAKDLNYQPRFARMESDYGRYPARLDFDDPAGEQLSCREWSMRDEERDAPLEFHPRFMRCLIAYGSARAKVLKWAAVE